jgi:hypothetical protein
LPNVESVVPDESDTGEPDMPPQLKECVSAADSMVLAPNTAEYLGSDAMIPETRTGLSPALLPSLRAFA